MPRPIDPDYLQHMKDAPTQAVTTHVAALRQEAINQVIKAKNQAVAEAKRLEAHGQIEKIEAAFDTAIDRMEHYKLGTETGQVAIKYLQDVETNIHNAMSRTGKLLGMRLPTGLSTRSKASILIGYGSAESDTVQAKLHKARHMIRNTILVNQDFYVSGRRKLMGTILKEGTVSPRMQFTHRFKLFSRDHERALSTRERFKRLQEEIQAVMKSRMISGVKSLGEGRYFELYAEIASLRAIITAQGANSNAAAYEALDIMTDQLAVIEQQEAIDEHGFVDYLANAGQAVQPGPGPQRSESQQRAMAFLNQLKADHKIDGSREIAKDGRHRNIDRMVSLANIGDRNKNIMVTVAQVMLENHRNKTLKMQDGTVADCITFMKTAMALGATKIEMINSFPSDYHLASTKERREYDQLTVVCASLRELPEASLKNMEQVSAIPSENQFEHLTDLAMKDGSAVFGALQTYIDQTIPAGTYDAEELKNRDLIQKLIAGMLNRNFPGNTLSLDKKAERYLNASPGNGLLQRAMLLPPELRTAFRKAVDSITCIDNPEHQANLAHREGVTREAKIDFKNDTVVNTPATLEPKRTKLAFDPKQPRSSVEKLPSAAACTSTTAANTPAAGGGRSAGGPPVPTPVTPGGSPLKRAPSARRGSTPRPVRSATHSPTPPASPPPSPGGSSIE